MSGQSDLNLDDILAEFHREEKRPAQAPAPRPARPRPAEPILSSGQKAEEGTLLYESRPARHAAPAAPTADESPAPKTAPKPRTEAREPQPRTERTEAQPRTEKPAPRQRAEKAAPAKRPGPGRGFALMILVLLLLGALLFGLVKWTVRAEKAAAPQEPEPLRLELGLSLEQSLDESAGTTR